MVLSLFAVLRSSSCWLSSANKLNKIIIIIIMIIISLFLTTGALMKSRQFQTTESEAGRGLAKFLAQACDRQGGRERRMSRKAELAQSYASASVSPDFSSSSP